MAPLRTRLLVDGRDEHIGFTRLVNEFSQSRRINHFNGPVAPLDQTPLFKPLQGRVDLAPSKVREFPNVPLRSRRSCQCRRPLVGLL